MYVYVHCDGINYLLLLLYPATAEAGLHYDQILTEKLLMEDDNIAHNEDNVMYNPRLLEYMMTHMMPFSIMWSGAQQKTMANAIAEIVFRSLKHDFASAEQRVDGFISRMNRVGRVQAMQVLSIKQYENVRSQKTKTGHPIIEEKWGPKRSRGQ